MGMDYFAETPIAPFHLTWDGHTYMALLLGALGADPHEWSAVNDGDPIAAATCRSWAALMRDGLSSGRITNRRVWEASSHAWEVMFPDVRGVSVVAAGPYTWGSDLLEAELAALVGGREGTEGAQLSPMPASHGEPLDDWYRDRIRAFADFLDACDGCFQC